MVDIYPLVRIGGHTEPAFLTHKNGVLPSKLQVVLELTGIINRAKRGDGQVSSAG